MAVLWEWSEDENISKELSAFNEAPSGSGYGARVLQDMVKPSEIYGLTAEGLTTSEVATYRTIAKTKGAIGTFTLVDGTTVTGPIRSFQRKRKEGTTLSSLTLSVEVTS